MLRSRVRRIFQLAPGPDAPAVLDRLPREQTAAAVYGGTPSVAHTEALLRGTVFKGVELDEPLDAIVIGIPPTTASMPRERPNPVNAAYLGLGLALRLWRNAPPLAAGGTAILVHPFARRFVAADADAVPRALLRRAHDRRHRRDARRRASRGRRREGDRRLPRGPRVPSAAAVRRVERLRRDDASARRGADRGLPRRAVGAAARLRAGARARRGTRDGARPRRASESVTCSRRRTSRSSSAPADVDARCCDGHGHRDARVDEEVRRPGRRQRRRPDRPGRRRLRLPRPERRRQDDHDPHAARADAADLR